MEHTDVFPLYKKWAQTLVPQTRSVALNKEQFVERIISSFSSINLHIDYTFACELTNLLSEDQFNYSMVILVANIVNVEQHFGIPACLQSMKNHDWLTSHATHSWSAIDRYDISVTNVRSMRSELYKIYTDLIRNVKDIYAWLDNNPTFLQNVDCCWSPYWAFRNHTEQLRKLGTTPTEWHDRLFTALKSRPITDVGYTMDNVVASLFHTWKPFEICIDGAFVGEIVSTSWSPSNIDQVYDRLRRSCTAQHIALTEDLMQYYASVLALQQSALQQKPTSAISCGSYKKVAKDNHPRKNKHVPSIPGHNKEKPWLSKHKKR